MATKSVLPLHALLGRSATPGQSLPPSDDVLKSVSLCQFQTLLTDAMVQAGPEADERKRLTAIEKEIDRIAGTKRWLKAADLPQVILYSAAQIEAVATKNVARLATECGIEQGDLEVGVTIDANRLVSDANFEQSRREGRVAGICGVAGASAAARCVCKEIGDWKFPPGCGMSEVRMKLGFGTRPPKVTVEKPAHMVTLPSGRAVIHKEEAIAKPGRDDLSP